jgi:hypothetical protein
MRGSQARTAKPHHHAPESGESVVLKTGCPPTTSAATTSAATTTGAATTSAAAARTTEATALFWGHDHHPFGCERATNLIEKAFSKQTPTKRGSTDDKGAAIFDPTPSELLNIGTPAFTSLWFCPT